MDNRELIENFNSHGDKILESFYGPESVQAEKKRYISLMEGISEQAGFPAEFSPSGDLRVFSAPGRTELAGNHTDHNRGRVLAASIQMDAVAVVAPLDKRQIFFRSTGFPDVLLNLDDKNGQPDLLPKQEEHGTTESLIRGIASEFSRRGVNPGGFCANASSTVLRGSGLSSSAALEVLIAKIFDSLYGGDKCSALDLARIGQKAENVFFGKPCGLMDQAASASGGAVAIDFADPALPLVKNIEFNPLDAGYALCVVNTRGSHSDLTPDYAAIPQEMNSVAEFFGKSFLREIELSQVLSGIPEIRKQAGDRALLRAIHFFEENSRVDIMAGLLEKMDRAVNHQDKKMLMEQYLDMVNESGDSSWKLLQNIYSTRKPAEQGVTLALAASWEFFRKHGIKAACRVHGGGFAGTIQGYIPVNHVEGYRIAMESIFGPDALTVLRIRHEGAVEIDFRK